MTTKTTKRRTALSSALGSKTFERVLIVAAVAAVLVAFGAWFAMSRPADADVAGARPAAGIGASGSPAAESAAAETTAPTAPAAAADVPAVESEAPAGSDTAAAPAPDAPAAPAAQAVEATPQTFLDEVSDSGLAPPVDDAQKLAMARDVCEEMGYGSSPDDMVRALTFAGASDEEAANFVQLAITNICPEHAR
jgi:hypothetical protein